ncbi:hypothetical protein GE061_016242 [Apolygus lucorum]|uniref:Uncharacterized protein n=1 Tax=Apolygus lucorum TaxID=248454 RepID=A0A6A4JR99_APOLU|nr:hypothetical protein GE061_016242 [Apolygus lucorum]
MFDSYMPPSPVISRCYSSKANMNSFATTGHIPGNSLFSMNKFLGNVGNFNKKTHGVGPPGLKMPQVKGNGYDTGLDPIVKIVGGFVGSKSQAGSSNHRGREFSLWDVILDKIIESMEQPKQTPRKCGDAGGKKVPSIEGFAMIGVRKFSVNDTGYLGCFRKLSAVKQECGECVCRTQFPELGQGQQCDLEKTKTIDGATGAEMKDFTFKSQDCYTPDLTDCSLNSTDSTEVTSVHEQPFDLTPPPSVENCGISNDPLNESPVWESNPAQPTEKSSPFGPLSSSTQVASQRIISESEDDSIPSDILSSSIESHADTFPPHRKVQRSISECSADSDDSFIVFESTEDEPVIFDESDDDDDCSTDEDLDDIDNCVLISHNCDFYSPQRTLSRLEEANLKWNKTYGSVPTKSKSDKSCASKKVKFAEGKDLAKVKRLVTWEFAHRAARVGPWEMYHRDSERFKSRISSLSSVISPVLAQKHRKKIYTQRFQT